MNVVSAQEVKRRGVAVLQEAAKQGSVHVLKNNRSVGVFLSEADYQRLTRQQKQSETSLLDWMLSKPATGDESAEAINERLQQEREDWD